MEKNAYVSMNTQKKKNKNEFESPFDVVILDHSMPKKKGKGSCK